MSGDLFGQLPRLRVLSLHQPWATAIAIGWKRWETRPWATTVRGEFAVHAAKAITPEGDAMHQGQFTANGFPGELPRGAIVALADLVDCRPAEEALGRGGFTVRDEVWGDFSRGRFAFELANVRPLRAPFPCSGRQGWFFLDTPSGDAVRLLAGPALEVRHGPAS